LSNFEVAHILEDEDDALPCHLKSIVLLHYLA